MQVLDPCPDNSKIILLLHGLGSEGSSWQLQFQPLIAAGYRPLAPDLPGFGGSRLRDRRWSARRVTQQLISLLRQYNRQPVPVVGISMGGLFALRLALAAPELVERLVLVNTFASLRPFQRGTALYLLTRLARTSFLGPERQAELVARRLFPQEERDELRRVVVQSILRADRRAYRSAMWWLGLADLRPALSRLDMPTLVISGVDDSTVPLDKQIDLARRIRQARHEVIREAGHAVIVDQPEAFNRLLLDFLGPAAVSHVEPPPGRSAA